MADRPPAITRRHSQVDLGATLVELVFNLGQMFEILPTVHENGLGREHRCPGEQPGGKTTKLFQFHGKKSVRRNSATR